MKREFCCFDNGPVRAMTKYQNGFAFIFDDSDKLTFISLKLVFIVEQNLFEGKLNCFYRLQNI